MPVADEQQPARDRDVARQAAISSLVSQLVYIAIIVGVSVAISKRDAITRAVMRVQRWRAATPPPIGPALLELHRDIARLEGKLEP